MKILILTLADLNYQDVAALSEPNKRAYAELHGYDFIQETELLDPLRSPSWNKIALVSKHLPKYQWVFWTDCDSLIMNSSITLESIIEEVPPDKDFIIAGDGNGINAGEFLIGNSNWSINFLADVWEQTQFITHPWWEQSALTYLFSLHKANREKLALVEQHKLNSYITPYSRTYLPGDFIVHFVGMGKELWNLVGLMRKYALGEDYYCVDATGNRLAGRAGCLDDC